MWDSEGALSMSPLVINDLESARDDGEGGGASGRSSKGRPEHSPVGSMCVSSPSPSVGAPRSQCHISCLPSEILLYIFSFLSVPELGRSVEPVCRAFRVLAKDPTLRKRLVFPYQNFVESKQVKQLLADAPHLLTLELQSREDGQDLLLQAAACCPKLRELTVKFCDSLTELVFKSLTENCPNLQSLNVEGSRVCSSACFYLMADFRHLRHLNLSHCDLLDDQGLMAIARQCQCLEYLDIDGITNIHDNSVMYLTQSLCHSLKSLLLDGEQLTNRSYQSLGACTHLQKLGVSFCEQMTDRGLPGILSLKQLTWLKLRKGTQLTPAGLRTLFKDGSLPMLAYINLGECCLLDDSVLEAMATCCPRMVHLALQWCWEVTDAGVSAILARCSRVRVLDLVGVVQLTGAVFSTVVTTLPDLVVLDLEQCNNVDETLLQVVVGQKPSLRVYDYWGDLVAPPDPRKQTEEDSDSAGTRVRGGGRAASQTPPPPQFLTKCEERVCVP